MCDKGLIFKICEQPTQTKKGNKHTHKGNEKKKKGKQAKNGKKNEVKKGRRFKQTFSPRRYTDGQQVHEKIFINHQENAHQNHNELSPYTVIMSIGQKDKK